MSFDRIIQGLGSGLGVSSTSLNVAVNVGKVIHGLCKLQRGLEAQDDANFPREERLAFMRTLPGYPDTRSNPNPPKETSYECNNPSAYNTTRDTPDCIETTSIQVKEIDGHVHRDEPSRCKQLLLR